jgi:hypothetical protein
MSISAFNSIHAQMNVSSTLSMPKLDREKAACRIQKAWRNSRSMTDLIKKDRVVLGEMSKKKFLRFVEIHLTQLKKVPSNVRSAFFSFDRPYGQGQLLIPVCNSVTSLGLPSCRMMDARTVAVQKYKPFPGVFIHVTEKAKREFLTFKPTSLTPQGLDVYVRKIFQEIDLFSWPYKTDGCRLLAQLAIELLILSGVPSQDLSVQYALVPEKLKKEEWIYHCAVLARCGSAGSRILDPALSPDKSLEVHEWLHLQTIQTSSPLKIVNLGSLKDRLDADRPFKEKYDIKNECLLFSTPINVKIGSINFKAPNIALTEFSEEEILPQMKKLADFRNILETRRIESLLKWGCY